jgi:hypothetical protein
MRRTQIARRSDVGRSLAGSAGQHGTCLGRALVEELEQFYDRITSCRVVVEAPNRHHREGRLYHIRVDLKAPGREIVEP